MKKIYYPLFIYVILATLSTSCEYVDSLEIEKKQESRKTENPFVRSSAGTDDVRSCVMRWLEILGHDATLDSRFDTDLCMDDYTFTQFISTIESELNVIVNPDCLLSRTVGELISLIEQIISPRTFEGWITICVGDYRFPISILLSSEVSFKDSDSYYLRMTHGDNVSISPGRWISTDPTVSSISAYLIDSISRIRNFCTIDWVIDICEQIVYNNDTVSRLYYSVLVSYDVQTDSFLVESVELASGLSTGNWNEGYTTVPEIVVKSILEVAGLIDVDLGYMLNQLNEEQIDSIRSLLSERLHINISLEYQYLSVQDFILYCEELCKEHGALAIDTDGLFGSVIDIIVEHCDVEPYLLTPQTSFSSLAVSSIDRLCIVQDIENEYDIVIPNSHIQTIFDRDIGELLRYLASFPE